MSLSAQINQLKDDFNIRTKNFNYNGEEEVSPKNKVKGFLLDTENFDNFLLFSESNLRTIDKLQLEKKS